MTNYPRQVFALKSSTKEQKKTLSFDSYLDYISEEEMNKKSIGAMQLHSGYSRYEVTIIVKNNNGSIFPKANIPALEVPRIYEVTKDCLHFKNFERKTSTNNNIIEETTLNFGAFKGRLPSEVLLENPNNRNKLVETYNFIDKNVKEQIEKGQTKFIEMNKKQMEGIKNAVNSFDKGTLSPSNNATVIIYKSEVKYRRKTDNEGYNECYSIEIRYNPTKTYDVEVTINTLYAPVDTKSNGSTLIILSKAKNQTSATYNCSLEKFFDIIRLMNDEVTYFEMINFKNAYNRSKELAWEPRKEVV